MQQVPSEDAVVLGLDRADAPAAPRFCRTCGAPWQILWTNCQNCASRLRHNISPLSAHTEQRATKSAIALFLTLLGICAVGMLVGNARNGLSVDIGVSIVLSAFTIVWCIVSWRTVFPLLAEIPAKHWFAAAVGLSLITYAIATLVIGTFQRAMNPHAPQMSDPFIAVGYGWGFVVLMTCVQPAIIEELAFRGVILGALQKTLRPIEAVMVGALMFMILHLSVVRFPHTLALGVAAGLIRTRTKSLYPCMLLHFSHNLMCVAGQWVAK